MYVNIDFSKFWPNQRKLTNNLTLWFIINILTKSPHTHKYFTMWFTLNILTITNEYALMWFNQRFNSINTNLQILYNTIHHHHFTKSTTNSQISYNVVHHQHFDKIKAHSQISRSFDLANSQMILLFHTS